MIKEFGNKSSFIPYTKIGDGTCIIMWDFIPSENDSEYGYWVSKKYNFIPDITLIKKDIISYYNDIIDKHILQDFEWKGMKVWLSQENQFNYKATYDFAVQSNGKNLPVTFKFEQNGEQKYYTFNDIDDLYDFYTSSLSFIQTSVKEGWEKKDKINWDLYK